MFRMQLHRLNATCGSQLCRFYLSHEFKALPNAFKPLEESRSSLKNESSLNMKTLTSMLSIGKVTNYEIVKQCVDTGSIPELLTIVKDRTQFGMYLDNYIGCYLLDHFLEKQELHAAAEIAVTLMLQDDLDSKLVTALSLKSMLEYLKTNPTSEEEEKEADEKPTEKKVRVKFLRNAPADDAAYKHTLMYLIGKSALRETSTCPKEIHTNMQLLGHLLCNHHEKFAEMLNSQSSSISKDILTLCQELGKRKTDLPEASSNALSAALEKEASKTTFESLLAQFVKDAAAAEEKAVLEVGKNQWKIYEVHQKSVQEQEKQAARQANIEKILEEIREKQQKLWYFEQEDKIDLDIFRKKVSYPKRWFGKKKKPRVVDDNYVPPEITKKTG